MVYGLVDCFMYSKGCSFLTIGYCSWIGKLKNNKWTNSVLKNQNHLFY